MAVVFTDTFTTGTTQSLQSYASADWAAVLNEFTVDAGNDRAERPFGGTIGESITAIARCIDGAMPTGDQMAAAAVNKGSEASFVGVGVRLATGGADTGYFGILTNTFQGNNRIIRRVAGTETVLASGGSTPADTTTYDVSLRAEGTTTVDLEFQGVGTAVTYSDSSGDRLTSGQPGFYALHGGFNANVVWLDDFEVDDLDAGGGYSLQCDPGAFALTGTNAMLRHERALVASPGSISLAGTQVTLRFHRLLTAQPGTVSLAGTDAGLRFHRLLTAQPGSIALTGVDAVLTYTPNGTVFELICTPGAIAIAGPSATLRMHRLLVADAGAITLAGTPANLRRGFTLDALPGSYALSGTSLDLRWHHLLSASPGEVGIIGMNASLRVDHELTAQPGSVLLSGLPASLVMHRWLGASAGAVAILGADAVLTYSGVVSIPDGARALRFEVRARTLRVEARSRPLSFECAPRTLRFED